MTQVLSKTHAYGMAMIVFTMIGLGLYFVFAAIQGDFGHLKRIEVKAEAAQLEQELAELNTELADIKNRTKRMSDSYLDLDLLDEQTRKILGYIRPDEIVVQ
ncbi:MAG: septum formation initiator family protein [Pseudomonadota bacterium]